MHTRNFTITFIICLTSVFIIGGISFFVFSSHFISGIAGSVLKNGVVFCGLLLMICCVTALCNLEKRFAKTASTKHLYDNILNNTNVGLGVITSSNEFEYANKQFKNLLCLDAFIVAGKQVKDSVPASVYKFFTDFRSNEAEKNSTFSQTIKEGTSYIYCTLFKSTDDFGSTKYVITAQDHTDLINLKNQIHSQLKEVQVHMQAKEALFANVSHELKTPLNAILGLGHILENTEITERQRDIVSKILVSSDYLLGLINDVLDYSKIKQGHLDLYPTSFSLTDLLCDVHDTFSSALIDKNVQWIEDCRLPEDFSVSMDRLRLEQILTNLVGNAVKFTDFGFIKVTVSVTEKNDDKSILKFIVEDTGIGIDKQDIPFLFSEFTQVENHLTKQHQGTGLGLSICKRLVEGMGGSIWVESSKGFGSKFIFTMPAAKDPACPKHSVAKENPNLYGHGEKVLVVEDTLINYEVVEELLSAVNISCDHAVNGVEAVEQCRSLPNDYYKVILMDIHMPKMDGYEASRILKQSGIVSPILALTATNIDSRIMRECADIIDGFILKPFKYTQLYSALLPYFAEDPFCGKEEAIKNLGNNTKLYSKHLAKFIDSYKDMPALVEKAIADREWSEAKRMVHSVKGLSGMLGLTYLEKASKSLEASLDERAETQIEPNLKDFQKKLLHVVQSRLPVSC